MNFLEARVALYLAYLKRGFLRKYGTIYWGEPPVVAPEGDLVFEGKPSRPFNFIQ
jgi:hypothetical protein